MRKAVPRGACVGCGCAKRWVHAVCEWFFKRVHKEVGKLGRSVSRGMWLALRCAKKWAWGSVGDVSGLGLRRCMCQELGWGCAQDVTHLGVRRGMWDWAMAREDTCTVVSSPQFWCGELASVYTCMFLCRGPTPHFWGLRKLTLACF
ncbi:hypothetical protein DUNSADRAFT_11187 [Dunaliella salina]|uniref:Encoded protein n=1 Tax=Dunaliella salina TaxID=3046 RepID=A0ABQ7GDX8_DUNSA|nr:hypothetical protein DUNSADRAFT_11187 [Dunaliella salina]|eukprot:KAF5832815.1 hypothetical protein DUNSADRAFT_11187 [Dunaliella salina]